ncbi:MAG: FAD-binding oxidoreductase [Candidatus Heimdallarchaeaceae archaeon]
MCNRIEVKTVTTVEIGTINAIKGEETINLSYAPYLVDESKMSGGKAEILFFPKNETEVVTIVKHMKEKGIPITIQGARTGIVGSAIPLEGALVAFDEMKEVLGLGYDEEAGKWFVRIQPGITLDELKEIVKYQKFNDDQSIPPEKEYVKKFKESGKKYFYPIDPTEMSAMIGGTVAANASGARTFKYGATREWVRQLRVVLASGDVLEIKRGEYYEEDGKFIILTGEEEIEVPIPTYQMPKGKNAAGYFSKKGMDLIDLFIGSEGTLGIITEIDLWIEEKPMLLENILFFGSEEDALNFVIALRTDKRISPEYLEFMDLNCLNLLRENEKKYTGIVNIGAIPSNAQAAILFGISYTDESIETDFEVLDELTRQCNVSLDDGWCAETEQEQENFHKFRHAVPEIVNNLIAKRKNDYPGLHKLGTDMSVSDEHLKNIMNFYHEKLHETGLEYAIWGHIGNNHVHVNILPRNMEELELGKQLYKKFAKKAVEYGGSVSAEHGIGKIKKEYLKIMFGEEGIKEMQKVKQALDENWLLNRGNIIDPI